MNIRLPKSSTVLFINISMFLIITIFAYSILHESIKLNNSKNQEILFYKIQDKSSSILTRVLYKYHMKKNEILKKHQVALDLYNSGEDIDEINETLNQNSDSNPFNIYILSSNLIIEDSTIMFDIGLNLSSLKPLFGKYKSGINVAVPEYSNELLRFISYSTSYTKDGKFFRISYTYDDLHNDLKELQEFINTIPIIKSSTAYIIYDDYVGDFAFKSIQSYKQTIEEIESRLEKGERLLKSLEGNNYKSHHRTTQDEELHVAYLLQSSPLYNDAKVLYCIVFNENEYFKKILILRLTSLFVLIIGTLAIYLTYRLRSTELLLNYKDKFIAHSIHEIKTPLSIISINTQLREKLYGSDKYTKKVEGALRTLENSYEDMTFLHTKDKIKYEIVEINLQRALENRVRYFSTIADTQNRKIEFISHNNFHPNMGKIELNRLIDNNISNAIKYSNIGSIIKIILKDNILEFHSIGQRIYDPKGIFKRYKREDKSSGGHGLGLAIVSDICDKYKFKIEVESRSDSSNIFRYILV